MSKNSEKSTPSAVNEHLDSEKITDVELQDWLTSRAAKTAAKDHERLKKEADLLRAVRTKLTRDDSTS